jgi:hypothetical protein
MFIFLKLFLFFASVQLAFASSSFAFIPRGMVILHKTAENNGSGGYSIEQEVHFSTDQEPVVLRESWLIDNENNMKLTVTGTKELKDTFKMQFLYSNGIRSSITNGVRQTKKLTDDFIERYFHIRSSESYAERLIQLKVVPNGIFAKKMAKTSKDFENRIAEDFIRLSRVGGVINYAFGTPAGTIESNDSPPGFWIEQDQFLLRKFRLPSGVEISADNYSQYSRGLNFPRKRTVRWDNSNLQIQTLTVSGRSTGNLGPVEASKTDALESLPIKSTIAEFYNRFR